jgi:hypothetical protein
MISQMLNGYDRPCLLALSILSSPRESAQEDLRGWNRERERERGFFALGWRFERRQSYCYYVEGCKSVKRKERTNTEYPSTLSPLYALIHPLLTNSLARFSDSILRPFDPSGAAPPAARSIPNTPPLLVQRHSEMTEKQNNH